MAERLPNGLTPEQDAAFDALARALAECYVTPTKPTADQQGADHG